VAEPYRILVTGSRDWDDGDLLAYQLGLAAGEGSRAGRRVTVVHGASPTGADAIADRLARDHGFTVEPHPADWRGGKAAGLARNSEMVAAGADVCLAFLAPCRKHASRPAHDSHGAADCAGKAEQAGIPVRRFRPAAKPEAAPKPQPARLWEQAGEDPERYRDLMRQHGHLLAPGDEGYEEGSRSLPCGWEPGKGRQP
jgi:hypothetical protein